MASSGHFIQMDGEYTAENHCFTTKDNSLLSFKWDGWELQAIHDYESDRKVMKNVSIKRYRY